MDILIYFVIIFGSIPVFWPIAGYYDAKFNNHIHMNCTISQQNSNYCLYTDNAVQVQCFLAGFALLLVICSYIIAFIYAAKWYSPFHNHIDGISEHIHIDHSSLEMKRMHD